MIQTNSGPSEAFKSEAQKKKKKKKRLEIESQNFHVMCGLTWLYTFVEFCKADKETMKRNVKYIEVLPPFKYVWEKIFAVVVKAPLFP